MPVVVVPVVEPFGATVKAFTYLSSSLTQEVSKAIKAAPLKPADFKNS
jgi:hypothetical protein